MEVHKQETEALVHIQSSICRPRAKPVPYATTSAFGKEAKNFFTTLLVPLLCVHLLGHKTLLNNKRPYFHSWVHNDFQALLV